MPDANKTKLTTSMRSEIGQFHAMDVMENAARLENSGERVIHLEVGQPSSPAPKPVLEAASELIADGRLGYTVAMGSLKLREKIAQYYADSHGIEVPTDRIVVTTGSSAGFNLAFLCCFDAGDRVALSIPSYPPYRNILGALGIEAVEIETGSDTRWALTPEQIECEDARGRISGVLTASPANPTGTMLRTESLEILCKCCEEQGRWFISDEIYHRLVYGGKAETALKFSDQAVVINSFSKYYCMTGWRIGWMVVPEQMVRPVERLAQNMYISAPELSQLAACHAFDPESTVELEAVKSVYATNRDILMENLGKMGFDNILPVDGAFYIYASVRNFSNDSLEFAGRMLSEARIAATPGIDFDRAGGGGYLRFSFCRSEEEVREAVDRLANWLG